MNHQPGKPVGRTLVKLLIDISIFVVFLVLMEPNGSGLSVHEWLSVAMIGAILVHMLLSWDWIVNVTRRFFGRLGGRPRLNYVLNWLLFIDWTVIMLSGLMISRIVVPSLGISLPEGFAWRRLHDLSANLSLVLLGLHTALHWNWIAGAFSRYLVQPVARLLSPAARKEVKA